ncbi:hypothetical protein M426DRAFT_204445 [Hypoxylon sp. CI-4A]|nr:hypothetical protein M426DRAFT_204445 [Hypoxylon sp. CI-4A]
MTWTNERTDFLTNNIAFLITAVGSISVRQLAEIQPVSHLSPSLCFCSPRHVEAHFYISNPAYVLFLYILPIYTFAVQRCI